MVASCLIKVLSHTTMWRTLLNLPLKNINSSSLHNHSGDVAMSTGAIDMCLVLLLFQLSLWREHKTKCLHYKFDNVLVIYIVYLYSAVQVIYICFAKENEVVFWDQKSPKVYCQPCEYGVRHKKTSENKHYKLHTTFHSLLTFCLLIIVCGIWLEPWLCAEDALQICVQTWVAPVSNNSNELKGLSEMNQPVALSFHSAASKYKNARIWCVVDQIAKRHTLLTDEGKEVSWTHDHICRVSWQFANLVYVLPNPAILILTDSTRQL